MRTAFYALLICTLTTSQAVAWHDVGHRTTASIAFDAMTATQQRTVGAILRAHPRYEADFAALMPTEIRDGAEDFQNRWLLEQAATWPDLIQTLDDDVKAQYNRSRWHYINLIVFLEEADANTLDGQLTHNMSTLFAPPLRQNLNSIQALRGNLSIWQSDRSTNAEKAVALCWILHLVGDMHQPLHNVALFSKPWFPEGDRGGNSVDVKLATGVSNLHAVWDGLPTDLTDSTPTARTLRTIETETVDDSSIDEWLSHHAQLAERFVYPEAVKLQLITRLRAQQSPQVELSHEYMVRARSIARRQVNLAGHRITGLLF